MRRPVNSGGGAVVAGGPESTMFQELFQVNSRVLGDLAKKQGRDVAPLVKRYGCDPASGVPELLVRPALANLDKAEPL